MKKSFLDYLIKNKNVFIKNNIKMDNERIENIIEKRNNNEFTISVFGTMKAGKSTFINSLIGDDLMPNQNEACTLTTTEIIYERVNDSKIIKQYKSGKQEVIEGKELSKEFHKEVKLSRETNSNEKFKYIVKHNIEAVGNQESSIKFTIVDTPGYNEMEGLGVERREIEETFDEELKRTAYIIYVFDYKDYKSQENIEILEKIKNIRPDIIKNNKISFVINKIDLMGYKDRSIDEVINDIKMMLNSLSFGKHDIFDISSKKALFARMIHNGKNINEYKKEIDNMTPMISKEIYGEVYDVKVSKNELEKILLAESGITKIEDKVIKNLFLNAENELELSIKSAEEEIKTEILSSIENTLKKYKEEVSIYNKKQEQKKYKCEILDDCKNKLKEFEHLINEELCIPSKEETQKRYYIEETYVHSDIYFYPYCKYDEYYRSESSAVSAAKSKFNSWKNTIEIDFNKIYRYYNSLLTLDNNLDNYYYKINTQISNKLLELEKSIETSEKSFNKFSGKKILTKVNIIPDPIMNLCYDNSQRYVSNLYDNSAFIRYGSYETYVPGIFGEKLKTVYNYDISNAIKNEEDDIIKGLNNCSTDFFNDFYKKRCKYIERVSEVAENERKKAIEIIGYHERNLNDEIDDNEVIMLNKINGMIIQLNEIKNTITQG